MQTRHSTLVCCALLCASVNANSQPATDSTPANCKWNLINPIFKQVAVTGPFYYGKKNASPAYNAVSYAGETECVLNTSCSVNDTSNLKMVVYYPVDHRYDLSPLPVMLISHAGGFSGCSSMNQNGIDTLCKLLALRGFVTFNIEYRRGRIKDTNPKYTSVQHVISMYRGCQDMRGAIRSIIKLQRNSSALNLPFRLDTNKIFLGGASAGAVMSLNAAYYRNSQMIDSAFPTAQGYSKIMDALGPINANFYYGDTTIAFRSKIKGVLCMWGGAPLPLSFENNKAAFFKSEDPIDNPPMIGFHGFNDPVFPISGKAKQRVYFSPASDTTAINYNKENFCLSTNVVLEGIAETPDGVCISGLDMYNILKKLGKLTEFYEDCEMAHGIRSVCDTCTFQSDFGTGLGNENAVYGYIAQRTATFFQAVMNDATPSDFANSTTLFVNCKNKRIKCNYSDNDNGCDDADTCAANGTIALMSNKPVTSQSYNNAIAKQKNNGITVYPNPVHDVLMLKGLNKTSSVKAVILDITGKILHSGTVSNGVYTASISGLSTGIYYIKLYDEQKVVSIPFVKD